MLTGIELLDSITASGCLIGGDEASGYHRCRQRRKQNRVVGDIRIERMTFCL